MKLKKDPTKTSLADGRRVFKDGIVANAIGSLDESNAFIGLAKVFAKNQDVKEVLGHVQRRLFKVGSEFAGLKRLEESDYEWILSVIEEFEAKTEKPKKFVILEKDEPTAFLSVARTVVRRVERWAVRLHREGLVSLLTVEWLNKLSYLLYLLILREGVEFEEV